MYPEHLKELLQRFQITRPVSSDEIEAFEREAAIPLPSEYLEFLRFTDGGESFIGPNSYAMLWKIDELLRFNREYEVPEYAPGLFLFGSNGGGEAFAFDLLAEGTQSFLCPLSVWICVTLCLSLRRSTGFWSTLPVSESL